MARFIQSFYIFAIDNLFLAIIRPKLEMDMRDIFSANAADFSVPMRNSLLFPACRAYAMPVAKSPFEVFRKASISAAKQLRLSNKGNKITTKGDTRRLCIGRLVRKDCQRIFASGNCLFPEKSIFLHTASPPRGNALAETFIYPRNRATHVNAVPAGFRGFLYPYGKPINQI